MVRLGTSRYCSIAPNAHQALSTPSPVACYLVPAYPGQEELPKHALAGVEARKSCHDGICRIGDLLESCGCGVTGVQGHIVQNSCALQILMDADGNCGCSC